MEIWILVKIIYKIFWQKQSEKLYLADDFNINLFDFEIKKNFKAIKFVFIQFCVVPTTNKWTRMTKFSAVAIDNVITNSAFQNDIKSVIVKNDISDHF